MDEIAQRESYLLEYAMKGFKSLNQLQIIGTSDNKTAVISFLLDDIHPTDVGTILDKYGVAVRTGHHCTQPIMERFGIPGTIRASLSFYNNEADIDALINGIKQLNHFLINSTKMAKIKEIERTPNPNAMRFVLAEPLTNGVTRSYENIKEAKDDRLASSLFEIEHVINVYYVDRYITVTQDGGAVWSELLRKLAPPIREAEAQENIDDDDEVHVSKEALDSDDPRLQEINRMLDEQVRPYLLADGGGLKVIGLEENRLKVHYQGACGTCPTATTGTLYAIESMVKRIDPEIEVISV